MSTTGVVDGAGVTTGVIFFVETGTVFCTGIVFADVVAVVFIETGEDEDTDGVVEEKADGGRVGGETVTTVWLLTIPINTCINKAKLRMNA
jgi:hypothetical protein